jgi:hypothetical protein
VKRLVRQISKAVNEGWVARVWLGLHLGLARWMSANHASRRGRRWTLRPNGPFMTRPWTGGRWGPKIALMGYLPESATLQDNTAATTLGLFKCQECCSSRSFEYVVNALAAQTRAFEISLGIDLSGSHLAVMWCHESKRLFPHLLNRNRVFSKILLEAHEDNGNAST